MAADADRLRAAADRLEWDASYMQPGDFPELQQERQVKTATATLLRDIAFTYPCECVMPRIESTCYWHIPAQQARWMRSALALSDTILGDSDV